MLEENISQEFRLRKINDIRNYLIEEMNQTELMSKKHEKFCRVSNYMDNSLLAISTITECVSISDFAPLVDIPIGITSSAIGSKICVITTGIKNCKSIIQNKRKKHNKKVLLAKSKLNRIVILISKALIDSNISHYEFVLIKNVLKEFYDMRE